MRIAVVREIERSGAVAQRNDTYCALCLNNRSQIFGVAQSCFIPRSPYFICAVGVECVAYTVIFGVARLSAPPSRGQ